MSYFLFIFKSALGDFAKNKMRTFLTSLGILIGVSSVILLLALGLGLKKYISNQFDSLGANLMFVMPGSKDTLMQGGGMIGGIKFDDRDVKKIQRIPGVKVVAPGFSKPGTKVKYRGKDEVIELVGSSENVIQIMNIEIEEGRPLEKKDVDKKAKVVMMSSVMAKKLFSSTSDALNKSITVETQTFKIIGIMKSKGGGGGGNDLDSSIYAPITALSAFNPDKKYFAIYLKSENKDQVADIKLDVERELLKRYEEDQFSVMDQGEIMGSVSSIFNIINTVLLAIAAISLIVGGVGIMNIMYVTVIERIREVGIRRALGATQKDILYQFLAEAVILSLIGGLAGLLLSYLVVFGVQFFFPAYIDTNAVILALGVSSAIGIIFGVFPARKAAALSPIEAIRYE